MPKRKLFEYEKVKRAARASKSKRAFCDLIGISFSSFYNYAKADTVFAKAYEDGLRERGELPTPPAIPAPAKIEAIVEVKPIEPGTEPPVEKETAPEKLSDEEIEAKILEALDADRRTLFQIKRYCGFPLAMDISDRLEQMQEKRQIRRESNANISAYFRFNQKPQRFWLSGKDTVLAVFDENFVPRDDEKYYEERRKAVEKAAARDKMLEAHAARAARPVVEIDEKRLEELAAEGLSQKRIAEKLGIGYSTLIKKLSDHPHLKEAYNRGYNFAYGIKPETEKPAEEPRETFAELKPVIEKARAIAGKIVADSNNGKQKVAKTPAQKRIEYTAEMFEQFGREGLSQKEISDRLGKDASTAD